MRNTVETRGLTTHEEVQFEPQTPPKEEVRLVIAIPSQDLVNAGFMFDLAGSLAGLKDCPNLKLQLLNNRGTILPQQRHSLATLALESKPTHILWLDADMRFPVDTILRLIAHDVDVVAANYATRRAPIIPTAEIERNELVFQNEDAIGLLEVSHVGMGVMLTKAHVFEKIPKPWFATGWDRTGELFVGEDVFFCRQLRKAGVKINIDMALSNEVRHCGEFQYTLRHANVTLEKAKQQAQEA